MGGVGAEGAGLGGCVGGEGGGGVIAVVGFRRDYPRTETAGWKQFAKTLPTPEIFDMVSDREPVVPLVAYRFPANRQRHYERLAKFPLGYLVLGDAYCSFNPIYGQGMSGAMSEARALAECLEESPGQLAARVFCRAQGI